MKLLRMKYSGKEYAEGLYNIRKNSIKSILGKDASKGVKFKYKKGSDLKGTTKTQKTNMYINGRKVKMAGSMNEIVIKMKKATEEKDDE